MRRLLPVSSWTLSCLLCLFELVSGYGTCFAQRLTEGGSTFVARNDPWVLAYRADAEFERDLRRALSDTLDADAKLASADRAIAVAANRLSPNHYLQALSVHALVCEDASQRQTSLKRADSLLPQILDERTLSWFYLARGMHMCRLGDYEQAAVALELARQSLKKPANPVNDSFPFAGPDQNEVCVLLAFCYTRLYDSIKAEELYGQLDYAANRTADRFAASVNRAEQQALTGAWAAAEDSLRQIDGPVAEISDVLIALMARFLFESGQVDASLALAETGLLQVQQSPIRMRTQGDLLSTAVKSLLRQGEVGQANLLANRPQSLFLLRTPGPLQRNTLFPVANPFDPAPSSTGAILMSRSVVDEVSDQKDMLIIARGEMAYLDGAKQEGIELIRSVAEDEEVAPAIREEAYSRLAELARDAGDYELASEAQGELLQMLRQFRNAGDRIMEQSSAEALSQAEQIARLKEDQLKMHFDRVRAEQNAEIAKNESRYSQELQWRSLAVAVVFGVALCVLLLVDRDRRLQTRLREKGEESNERLACILEQKSQALMRELEERVALEKSLERKRRDESIGQLTGNVAHDFNNLLQVILTTNEFLAKQASLNEDQAKMLSISNKSAHIGASIVKQLLSYARQQTLAPSVVSLTDYLDGTSTLLRAAVDQKCVLRISDESHGASVVLDPTQLTTALMNLLKNAVDAMPSGGDIQLRIFRQQIEHPSAMGWKDIVPGEYIAFEVEDSGKGMSDEELAMAFEPFYTTKPPAAGTGLGLSSVYGFVKQSGGDVVIKNRQETGICVSMVFPLSEESVEPEAVRTGGMPQLRCRMLLVEDNHEVGRSILTKVRSMGIDAELVTSGTAAVERLLRGDSFDLVLSDVRMPGEIDGIHLRAWIQENMSHMGVILMSGYSDIDELPAGSIILQKPFSESDLLHAMSLELHEIESVSEMSM